MITLIKWLLYFFNPTIVSTPTPNPAPEPPQPQPPPMQPIYHFDTPKLARHSIRVICDEMSMPVDDKNLFCATMGAESGWNPKAIGKPNFDGTQDYGICQINTKYWIGDKKTFPSTDYVLNNPEACIRWAIKEWQAGHRNYWYGYTSGRFAKYL